MSQIPRPVLATFSRPLNMPTCAVEGCKERSEGGNATRIRVHNRDLVTCVLKVKKTPAISFDEAVDVVICLKHFPACYQLEQNQHVGATIARLEGGLIEWGTVLDIPRAKLRDGISRQKLLASDFDYTIRWGDSAAETLRAEKVQLLVNNAASLLSYSRDEHSHHRMGANNRKAHPLKITEMKKQFEALRGTYECDACCTIIDFTPGLSFDYLTGQMTKLMASGPGVLYELCGSDVPLFGPPGSHRYRTCGE